MKFYLRRKYLDSQGYDSGGYYWGVGQPLYYCESVDDQSIDPEHFRASSREAAKDMIRKQHPDAVFFS